MGKIYIITGANGHLGNTIARKLVADNQEVRALVLPDDPVKSLDDVKCDIFYGDVTDKNSLEEIFNVDSCDETIVIHCAGIVSIASKYQQKVYNVNVLGTKNIVDMALSKHVSKFVYVSSVHAIKEPPKEEKITEVGNFNPDNVTGLYAKTKAEATNYVLSKTKEGFNACVVHPSGIIGPNDYGHGHLTQMIMDYLDGRLTACVKGGYDFVDVRDVADGVLRAVEHGKQGECYILSNQYFSVLDILNRLSKISGKKPIKTVLPLWFAKLTAPLAEKYYKILNQPPLYTSYSLFTLSSNANFSHEKATKELGYINRNIDDTLSDTVDWLIEHDRVPNYHKKYIKQKRN